MRTILTAVVLTLSAAIGSAETVTIQVQGMTCGGCAATVASALKQVPGVSDARVSYEKGEAVVTYEAARVTPEAIARAAAERLPSYKLSSGGVLTTAGESPKSCARPAVATSSLIPRGQIDPERLTFYEVGLVCSAAPRIGCGSRSKPVLLTLINDSRIAGAWLNEAGTRLAIGWKTSKDIPSTEQVDQLLVAQGISVRDVPADARAELVTSFRSGAGWFDAASVDRLSEQEAGIIAARFVKRLAAKVTITPEQQTALRNAIEQACRKRFIDGEDWDVETQFAAVAKEAHLDARAVAALREVVALGFRPLPSED